MAASLVGAYWAGVMRQSGREFYKMSGSGNDFVFVDAREEPAGRLADRSVIAAICARGTGVGADGIVFLERSERADFGMRYLNSDGSVAALCGNASLCAARLAVELGAVDPHSFAFETSDGIIAARIRHGAVEIDLQQPRDVRTDVAEIQLERGERRLGFALVGVPHAVVLCDDVAALDVGRRGRALRHDSAFPEGANVDFLARTGAQWRYRTFERGVEGETLACGTGAVACAVLAKAWGLAGDLVHLRTSSGLLQTVQLPGEGATLHPSLSGEARIVFQGRFAELS